MGLEIVAQMIANIGIAAQGAAKDLSAAADAASAYSVAAGEQASAGMYAQREFSQSVTGIGATSLGDPRTGPDQMMKLYDAIEAAKRGR